MCVIVYVPDGQKIPRSEFDKMWFDNSDGGGVCYQRKDRLVVSKGHMAREAFWKAYLKAKDRTDGPLALHFRLATHGLTDRRNTHPHVILRQQVAVMHNGVLPLKVPKKSHKSDTRLFVGAVLSGLPFGWWKNDSIRFLIETWIGENNKLLVMPARGTPWVAHEDKGEWLDGVWYSNTYWLRRTKWGDWVDWRCEVCGFWMIEEEREEVEGYKLCPDCKEVLEGDSPALEECESCNRLTPRGASIIPLCEECLEDFHETTQ